MKKISRLGVLLGILAGASVVCLVPSTLAQDAGPGPASELMENVDISMQGPPPPPDMPPPDMGNNPPPPPPQEGLLAMNPGDDLMLIRAGVRGNFSDDQLEKMYAIKMDFMDKAAEKAVEMKLQERALHDLITQPDFEKSKVLSIQSKINALRSDLSNMKLEQQIALLNTLTPDQRKELRHSYIKHMAFGSMGMGHGMGRGMGRGMGPGGPGFGPGGPGGPGCGPGFGPGGPGGPGFGPGGPGGSNWRNEKRERRHDRQSAPTPPPAPADKG